MARIGEGKCYGIMHDGDDITDLVIEELSGGECTANGFMSEKLARLALGEYVYLTEDTSHSQGFVSDYVLASGNAGRYRVFVKSVASIFNGPEIVVSAKTPEDDNWTFNVKSGGDPSEYKAKPFRTCGNALSLLIS